MSAVMLVAAALVAMPMLQSRHQHRQQLELMRQLKESELELQRRLHQETMEKAKERYNRNYRVAMECYVQSMALKVHLARRETMRDVWQQRNLLNQTFVIVNGLMFACAFETLTQGFVADGSALWLVFANAISVGLGIACLVIGIWCNFKLQARMSSYDTANIALVYDCGHTHAHFNAYFDCHCKSLQRVAVFLFYVGTCMVLLTSATVICSKFVYLWGDTVSVYLFLPPVLLSIVVVGVATRMVRSRTHDSTTDYGGLVAAHEADLKAAGRARARTEYTVEPLIREMRRARKQMYAEGAPVAVDDDELAEADERRSGRDPPTARATMPYA